MMRDNRLTPHARKLLNVLIGSGFWLTHEELAQAIGKARLTHRDRELLKIMVEKELIAVRRRRVRKLGVPSYEYTRKR